MKTPKLRFLSLHFACLCEISDQNLGDLCLTYHQKMAPKQHENVSGTVRERLNEKRCENLNKKRAIMSGVGLKPTSPFGDQHTRYHSNGKGISP